MNIRNLFPFSQNFYRKTLVTLFVSYILLVGVVTLTILAIYALVFPGTISESISMLRGAISASFNLNNYTGAAPKTFRDNPGVVLMVILFVHAFSILVLNMIFQAVITAKLIKPAIDLRISDGGVYHPSYGLKKTPHILFRLVNASHFDLHLVTLKAFLTVHDEHPEDPLKSMLYYFPVTTIDPDEIPVLRPLNPWIVAIPVGGHLKNSICHDYSWQLDQPTGSQPGKRRLEVLVSGNETEASTSFMRAFTLNLEMEGPHGLICGAFESLPCFMKRKELGAINNRISSPEGICNTCPEEGCRFQTKAKSNS